VYTDVIRVNFDEKCNYMETYIHIFTFTNTYSSAIYTVNIILELYSMLTVTKLYQDIDN